nr:UDP-glycosyltransferase 73C3-like [Ipomoea batatas]
MKIKHGYMTSAVVAVNTPPIATIIITSPRRHNSILIHKAMFEIQKSKPLPLNTPYHIVFGCNSLCESRRRQANKDEKSKILDHSTQRRPLQAFNATLSRTIAAGLNIHLLHLTFPASHAGLPESCENIDALPSLHLAPNFFAAINMLCQEAETAVQRIQPPPTCLISDMGLPWTAEIALNSEKFFRNISDQLIA